MPQHLCSECCEQIRQMYLFVEQIQQCNAELSKMFGRDAPECIGAEQTVEFHAEGEMLIKEEEDKYNACDTADLKSGFAKVNIETVSDMDYEVESTYDFERLEGDEEELTENIDHDYSYSFDIVEIYSDNDHEKDEDDTIVEEHNFESVLTENEKNIVDDDMEKASCDEKTSCGKVESNEVLENNKSRFSKRLLRKREQLHTSHASVDISEATKSDSKANDPASALENSHSQRSLRNREKIKLIPKVREGGKIYFPCEYCFLKCPSRHGYKVHLAEKHNIDYKDLADNDVFVTEEEKYKCDSCDYFARTRSALYYHKQYWHGNEEDKIQCKFCSYVHFKKCRLFKHMKNFHLSAIKTLRRNLEKKGNKR